ncbi:DUF6479 family protein [Streptomyces sp. NBC_00083]|uniref:DUF6479 family protein n=1 Tax=Streptomyces sp. NBC_00083 TaxID=2975647 RepID=UPI00224F4ACE|nr:DUF6479 family protein [Streptomyces sp. NBC_00083]MCX5387163.1 DUF6479 family protein [Streptomyces sp. NBC_00083]
MNTFASSQVLAAGSTAFLFTGVGIVIVAVLLGTFWFGSRRAARKPMPPREPQPRSESWQTPDAAHTSAQRSDPEDRA